MTPQERQQAAESDLIAAGVALADIARMLGLPELNAFDLETTGELVDHDRICELAAVKVRIVGEHYIREVFYALVHPGMPISDGATAVHGITNEMVADKQRFEKIAPAFLKFFSGVPILGYNIGAFDLRILVREFRLARMPFVEPPAVIDPFRIFQVTHPRDLTAAVQNYLGETLADAHQGGADVLAAVRVARQQFFTHGELPRTLEGIREFCNPPREDFIDIAGKFRWRNGVAMIAFGKHMGTALPLIDKGFLKWMLDPSRDFDADTMEIARDALRGVYPQQKVAANEVS